MGAFLSSLCDPAAKHAGSRDSKHNASPHGFTSAPNTPVPVAKKGIDVVGSPDVGSKTIPNDLLPLYTATDEVWAQAILMALKSAHDREWLQAVRDRHHVLYIDDNFRMERSTKDAIRIFACCLLLVYRAFDADATLFFTSQRNSEDKALPQDVRNKAAYLDNLFSCQNWYDALRLAESSLEDQDLGIWKWMNATAGDDDTTEERFLRLLAHIREQKISYWTGWQAQQLECDDFLDLYKAALARSREQPKHLNSLGFTIKLAIGRANRMFQWEKITRPTSFVILTGSHLQESEVQSIKNDLKQIRGGGREFSVEVVPFVKMENDPSLQAHCKLDDLNSGEKDIYDFTAIVESLFLRNGPSATLIAKILNSHIGDWDDRRITEKNKYGKSYLRLDNHQLRLPSLEEVKMVLELQDDM